MFETVGFFFNNDNNNPQYVRDCRLLLQQQRQQQRLPFETVLKSVSPDLSWTSPRTPSEGLLVVRGPKVPQTFKFVIKKWPVLEPLIF